MEGSSGNKKKAIDSLYLIKFRPFNKMIKEKNISKTGKESDRG